MYLLPSGIVTFRLIIQRGSATQKGRPKKPLESAKDLKQVSDKKWVVAAPVEEAIEPVRSAPKNSTA
ncbi:hypothetical protein DSO57_1032410 [Entomophthora muscae]|uniref:Uncharacterized protein n=1 Tax=Entomophthora muscae TaxID=34485 RepID=A0ACC2T0D3_9FUNG|nr:hypothetical protein DSO57_1032410 [Entomophthora muscae]